MTAMTPVQLVPLKLKDAPALIETVFPAQKISFEAQRERKSGPGQTLTALGSYWKGRKPLVLVRAILLGSLLPQSDDAEQDLALFEALMGFDIQGLGRRAVDQAALKPAEIAKMVSLDRPWDYFNFTIPKGSELLERDVSDWSFPLDANDKSIRITWKRGISNEAKAHVYSLALATLPTYEERSLLCKRPEEVNQLFLLAPVWKIVNESLFKYGVKCESLEELVEQLGILRYGHRPKIGDAFAGGGSIPFEAGRIGADVNASDLNPIACMLTWAGKHILAAGEAEREVMEAELASIAERVDSELIKLGIEHNNQGDRAKAFLYCLEVTCPQTGWKIPLAPGWVISKTKNVIAKLTPDYNHKRFDITIKSNASREEIELASIGTIMDGNVVYQLHGKRFTTPIKSIRGDRKGEAGKTVNDVRPWHATDIAPRHDDLFQERLYCIQWIRSRSLSAKSYETYFSEPDDEDFNREQKANDIVKEKLLSWMESGIIPSSEIIPGGPPRYQGKSLVLNQGWTMWHHLFNPRQLLTLALFRERISALTAPYFLKLVDHNSKLCRWNPGYGNDKLENALYNQAFNACYSFGGRGFLYLLNHFDSIGRRGNIKGEYSICCLDAREIKTSSDIWITDPPYSDAVMYHEITDFFISWIKGSPPLQFQEWKWDSRRALAIKGEGDDFRRGMIDAYSAMTKNMPDNGMQCVMFTHQSTEVWSDMVGIFWAAGLQVVAAWYIATETSSDLKQGGYVQGTVTLMLRKRSAGEKAGFKQRILPAVRNEVAAQIKQMLHLNDEVEARMGEPVFNDADLQMAGYAAALKVLTAYTKIGETDVTTFALRPRVKGEITVVDEIVQQASEAANSLLVPEGVALDTWQAIDGIQRFYLRMLDMESVGASKLDNYQNFAKAFRVDDYTKVMASMTANGSRLKQVDEFGSRELIDSTEIGPTWLGHLIIAIQQLLTDVEPESVVKTLMEDLPDYLEVRPKLIDLVRFLENKSRNEAVRSAAEVLVSRIQTQRLDS